MEPFVVLLVLGSAVLHPVWNLIIKKNPDPQFGYLCLAATSWLCALSHGLIVGADFSAVTRVLPFVALSAFGQILYGTCLTATLKRGDLSAYYPIIRASPVFIVAVSMLFLGQSYPLVVLLGILMAVIGGFLLLYRRGSRVLDDPLTLGLAILAMAGTGIYSLSDAQMMQTVKPQVTMTAVGCILIPYFAVSWLLQRSSDRPTAFPVNIRSLAILMVPGLIAYISYYLILLAYQHGGDVAAVTSVRQASIPISVALGGLFLREGAMARRFFAAGLLASGIIVIASSG